MVHPSPSGIPKSALQKNNWRSASPWVYFQKGMSFLPATRGQQAAAVQKLD
jgi:hypothetical protein